MITDVSQIFYTLRPVNVAAVQKEARRKHAGSTQKARRKHPSFPIKAESGTHTKKATFLGSTHGCFLRASFCCIINGSQCTKSKSKVGTLMFSQEWPQVILGTMAFCTSKVVQKQQHRTQCRLKKSPNRVASQQQQSRNVARRLLPQGLLNMITWQPSKYREHQCP